VFTIPEVQVHPFKFYMVLAAVEYWSMQVYSMAFNLCAWSLDKLFAASVFFATGCDARFSATVILMKAVNMQFEALLALKVLLNTFISLELIFVIRYPFTPPKSREPYYFIIGICVTGYVAVSTLMHQTEVGFNINKTLLQGLIVSYAAITLLSVVYSAVKLCSPGIG
jgi:hypothetical protein